MNTRTLAVPLPESTDLEDLRVGVEEELLLIDRRTGVAAPTVTLAPPASADLAELGRHLVRARRAAASAAAEHGAYLLAVGAAPDRDLTGQPAVCGLTVRIGVPDGRTAVRVSERLRAWLPVIHALTANSPFFLGVDTGMASWRFAQVQRRALGKFVPAARSTGPAATVAAELQEAERRLPEAMRYWHVRPSGASVHVRAGDVGLRAAETVVVAALLRAAAAQAADAVRDGPPADLAETEAVRAGHWQAARDGLAGCVTDPRCGRPRPAWHVLGEFAAALRPALAAADDLDLVSEGFARLRAEGTGADRQRRIVERAGDVRSALPALAGLTTTR